MTEITTPVCKTSDLGTLYITNEPPDLSEVVDSYRRTEAIVRIDAYSTENGQPATWIVANNKGLVTFFNQISDRTAYALDNGLKVGSQCSASVLGSASSSTPSGPPASLRIYILRFRVIDNSMARQNPSVCPISQNHLRGLCTYGKSVNKRIRDISG